MLLEVRRASESRRRRVYYVAWEFDIGSSVRYSDMCATVLSRHMTVNGRAFYNIWIADERADIPYRWVFGRSLT